MVLYREITIACQNLCNRLYWLGIEAEAPFDTAAIIQEEKERVMTLLENWRQTAYETERDARSEQMFWANYFNQEKGIYEQILESDEPVSGTVKELAEKFGVGLSMMVGYLDGINDSLKEANPIETMEEDTVVSLAFDKEKLYKNMVDARADWLYELPQWNDIYDEETRKRLFLEQRKSGTIRKEKKIGRNDPCPCGSGKKYKKCCGRNV